MRYIVVQIFLFLALSFLLPLGIVPIKKIPEGGIRLCKLMNTSLSNVFPEILKGKDLLKCFDKPCRYLSRGTQFYVFESYDKKYVIKLLRSDRVSPLARKRFLSENLWKTYRKKKEIKKQAILDACQIAHNLLSKETGVIYTHLQSTQNIPQLTYNNFFVGKKSIDLNRRCFVIQKKVVLFKEALLDAKEKGDIMLGKNRIHSFFELLKRRIDKQVSNTDPNLFKNFGFDGNEAIELDFGDYFINPSLGYNEIAYKNEILRYADILNGWVRDVWPELSSFCEKMTRRYTGL